MSRYLIVAPGYPDKNNIYINNFVHARVKSYIKRGLSVEVFSLNKQDDCEYEFDEVSVHQGGYERLKEYILLREYDTILIHFCFKKIYQTIRHAAPKTPLLIWVHGYEALGWYRRLFDIRLSKLHIFLKGMVLNVRQLLFFRHLIRNARHVHFIFVSEWMKRIAEQDTLCVGKIDNYSIIPNVVDESMFVYASKREEDRLRILSLRSFGSRKYANDLTVKAICLLSEKPFFSELSFSICGTGRMWNKTVAPLKVFPNVQLKNSFYLHDEIVKLHAEHGVALMPSRQDAQGVSTCEAMCSGLVPVTSNNTAIPEYVPMGCGYLANNAKELANAIEDICDNPEKYLKYSQNAAAFIRSKCANDVVIRQEIALIKKQNYHE